ncbi:protein shisa-7 isoform X1 [Oncorhynchus kisutch]|uniref:Shisa family member 7 n=1 Tax=Oncorhynchus kisutch TaxID=8019 RepID=A0A8C7M8U6_ONCKI|nr:protein shisa-7 isoform X1 [Oncorhynchus kisutch]XP_031645216.1 protein shisa-7 isoform X1 [Oncorhynchus kisutch]
MRPRTYKRMFSTSLIFSLVSGLVLSAVTITTERRSSYGGPSGTTLFLLTGFGNKPMPPPPGGPKVAPKAAEMEDAQDGEPKEPETLPKPLPQIKLPQNMTAADALKPPLGAAQVAPPPRRLVDVDVCRAYYDVMGQLDNTFNCSKGTYIYCCGTCHYRYCCDHQRSRLDQKSCNNYKSPGWLDTPPTNPPPPGNRGDPDSEQLQQQSNSTAYVIGGVISVTLVVAVGIKVAFHKISRRPRNRDINMPRALVDILRSQASPVQQGERNNSTVLTTATTGDILGRPPKNLYTPVLQSKDNRIGNLHHNFIQVSGSSPKHSATMERVPRMNNAQLASTGTLLTSKHNNSSSLHLHPQPPFSHSFHNLAQLPPSYEVAMKPEINRYSSLKKLEKDLDDYSGYHTSKRRPNNAPPSFHSSQHHLHWGGDYTLGARGTLPFHSSRPRIHVPTSTPNPYPLPAQSLGYQPAFDKPPRRVMSQDQLLALGEGNTLSRLSKNQQHQYYKAMTKSSTSQTLRKSHERLLVSPDRLEERMGGMGMPGLGGMVGMGGMGDFVGMGVPTMGCLSHKAQSQQNVCVTPSLDRHHMIKMNSHPTSGHELEMSVAGHPAGSWGDPHGHGSGAGVGPGSGAGTIGGHNARRMAFATKRQNTIEQLQYIPGGGGGGGGGQTLRTASKNEVTV